MGAGRRAATIPKDRFPHFVKELMNSIRPNQEKNIKSGFRKCGIYPLDRDQVLNRLPSANTANVQEVEEHVSNVVVNMLKSMRYSDTPTQRRKRKKVAVVAGKSVTGADFREEEQLDSDAQNGKDIEENESSEDEEVVNRSEGEVESDDEMNIPLSQIAQNQKRGQTSVPVPSVSYKGRIFKQVYPVSKESIQLSDWLLVAFSTSFKKNEKLKYYIGKVLKTIDENDDIYGTFLRHRQIKQSPGFIYGFPAEPDVCYFSFDQVVGQIHTSDNFELPSSSKREILKFPVNQNDLN